MKKKEYLTYKIYAWTASVMWALSYIFNRVAVQYFEPVSLNILRYSIASICCFFLLVVRKARIPSVKEWPLLFVCGSFGFTIHAITCSYGAKTVPAGTSSIIFATIPIMTAVMASLLYKERLAIQEKTGVILELAGIVVMFVWEGFKGSKTGLAILLVSAFSFAMYNILQRKVCKYYDVLDAIGYCTISASMPLLFFAPKEIVSHSEVPVKAWLCIAALGILCSVMAYILWASALKNARKTMEIANCQYINILITTMAGFVVLAEIPDIQTIIGAIITITGMIIFGKGSIE